MCRSFNGSRLLAATMVLVASALGSAAHGVVIPGDSSVATIIPGDDPGWNNVASMSDGSAVYLGNGWMITANHVPDGPVTFSDGQVFDVTYGTDATLQNPASSGATGSPDLRLFRIDGNPGLPSLTIAPSRPRTGSTVTMIGYGRDKAPSEIGWNVTTDTTGANSWKQAPLTRDNASGFALLSTREKHWGTNAVLAQEVGIGGTGSTNVNATIAFVTSFQAFAGLFNAQAAPGDSGGGVFEKVGGSWNLVGIMDAIQPIANQPSDAVVFGDSTYTADLSVYRDQILNIIDQPISAWQNSRNPYDVNGSGVVTAQDALVIINELQRLGGASLTLTGTPGGTNSFYDVNGDGIVSPQDLLFVIDALTGGFANPTASAQANVQFVPEPSTAALVLAGLFMAGLVRGMTLARRKNRRPAC